MEYEFKVSELVGSVLDKCSCILCSHFLVEMEIVGSLLLSFLGIHLIPKVNHEFLQVIHISTLLDIENVKCSLKYLVSVIVIIS